MTNGTPDPSLDLSLGPHRCLADFGLGDTRGIEILRLVRYINSAYDNVLADRQDDGRMTQHRWRVLWRIWMEEQMGNAPVNPTLLSRSEQVSKNTISDHLRGLEEAGLIERTIDHEDRRQFRIGLTPAGRELIVHSTPIYMRQLNQLLTGLSEDDVAMLRTLLTRLHRTILTNAAHMPASEQ